MSSFIIEEGSFHTLSTSRIAFSNIFSHFFRSLYIFFEHFFPLEASSTAFEFAFKSNEPKLLPHTYNVRVLFAFIDEVVLVCKKVYIETYIVHRHNFAFATDTDYGCHFSAFGFLLSSFLSPTSCGKIYYYCYYRVGNMNSILNSANKHRICLFSILFCGRGVMFFSPQCSWCNIDLTRKIKKIIRLDDGISVLHPFECFSIIAIFSIFNTYTFFLRQDVIYDPPESYNKNYTTITTTIATTTSVKEFVLSKVTHGALIMKTWIHSLVN